MNKMHVLPSQPYQHFKDLNYERDIRHIRWNGAFGFGRVC